MAFVDTLPGRVLVGLLGLVGIATGGSAAFAAGEIEQMRGDSYEAFPTLPLAPSEAAVAVVKGVMPQGIAEGEAQRAGLTAERFASLVALTGNPPGPQELLQMLRFGLIDRPTFDAGLRQGYLKNEWIPTFAELQFVPVSTAEAVQAAVQNQITVAEAQQIAAKWGTGERDFTVMFDTAGNPPGPQELLAMWRRGILTREQAAQGLRESRLKDKYVDQVLDLVHTTPPPRTITTLLSHGAIDEGTARDLFVKAGLPPELAGAYIASAQHSKTASHKELAIGTVKSLYVDRLVTRADALTFMARAGYQPSDATLVLDLADFEAAQKLRNQAVTRIRSLLTGGHITTATASADLDRIGVPTDQRDHLLGLWALEVGIVTRSLTVGQLNAAFKKGLIDRATFTKRVETLGYSSADATLLADIDVPPTAP